MDNERTILLVEDSLVAAQLIGEMLSREEDLVLLRAGSLAEALAALSAGGISLILLDLGLPDSQGLNTYLQMSLYAGGLPIIVLMNDNRALGLQAVQAGAQDYLLRERLDRDGLMHAVACAMERQRLLEELRLLSLTDELTGLYNRRGFLSLAEQQRRRANRMLHGMQLLLLALDEPAPEGERPRSDQRLQQQVELAQLLRGIFRASDLLARLSAGEFAVLAVDCPDEHAALLIRRIEQTLALENARLAPSDPLSLSLGVARYQPERVCSIEELLALAAQDLAARRLLRQRSSESRLAAAGLRLPTHSAVLSLHTSIVEEFKAQIAEGKAPSEANASISALLDEPSMRSALLDLAARDGGRALLGEWRQLWLAYQLQPPWEALIVDR